MQTNPTHFIEVIKYPNQQIHSMTTVPIRDIEWALKATKSFGFETIAIFKIYPKVKPAVAHYDYDLKTTIVE